MNENIVFSDELSAKEVAQIIVDLDKDSERVKKMKEADKYYDIKNPVILLKKRVYYDKDRTEYDNPSASNVRIPSTFLRTLVEEKRDYALGKAFVLSIKKGDEEVDNKDEYHQAWFEFLEKTLYEFVANLATQSVNHGIGWAYLWIDEDGNFRIDDMPGDSVYPIWKDRSTKENINHKTQLILNTQNIGLMKKGIFLIFRKRMKKRRLMKTILFLLI